MVRLFIATIMSVPFTAIALVLAIASAGAGHGDYVLARLLFPGPMLLVLTSGDVIRGPSIITALLQFPIYFAIVGLPLTNKFYKPTTITLIAIFHIVCAIFCFSGILHYFSR